VKKILTKAALFGTLFFCGNESTAQENDSKLNHECTSWMVFSDLTGNNTNILHKNRDALQRTIVMSASAPGAARQWISLGSGTGTNMGISRSGLAGVMNSGEKCINFSTNRAGKSTPAIMQHILENCDTAAQAVEKLKEIIKANDYWHKSSGSTFFFMDSKEGFICEMTAKTCTVQRYDQGYAVRANIWQNPNMQQNSRNDIRHYLNSSARAYIAFSGLNAALDKHNKITLSDIFDLSRHWQMPKESPEKRSVCFSSTNSSASLELDRQYPGTLSTAYCTFGHPRHTVYVPVPVCARKFREEMTDNSWSAASWKRLKAKGLGSPIPAEWSKYEADFLTEYAAAREEARKLLNQGKQAEAENLLNAAAEKIWEKAAAVLGQKK
jgi:hypothetical protein